MTWEVFRNGSPPILQTFPFLPLLCVFLSACTLGVQSASMPSSESADVQGVGSLCVLLCKFSLPDSHPTESGRAFMRVRVNRVRICCNN